jgi:hypothetical protein
MVQVFISYAHEDLQAAQRLNSDLKAAGWQTWFDEDTLLPGQNWKNEIVNAITQCKFFVAMLSSNSVKKRGFIQKELKYALDVLDQFPENDVFIIPVRLEACKPSYAKLNNLHWVDLFPSWQNGLQKILLAMEQDAGNLSAIPGKGIQHPREKSFRMTAFWTQDGLEIRGGNIKIPARDTMALFKVWLDWVPEFIKRKTPECDTESTFEQAYITGTIRAFYEVFGIIASEEEMERGSSILSRKLNLFYSFASDLYEDARKKGIDPKEYLLQDRTQLLKIEGELSPEEEVRFYRTLLRAYVSRVCDVNLEEVEKVEEVMRHALSDGGLIAPAWEELVEGIYEVNEEMVLREFQAAKTSTQNETDEQIVDNIIAHLIKSARVEEIHPIQSKNK